MTENIQGLRTALREVKAAHPFTMEAVVILPDRLPCIWTLLEGDDDFSGRWRQIKAAFFRQSPKTEHRSKSRFDKGERGIWQRWFWVHAMRRRWLISLSSASRRSGWEEYDGIAFLATNLRQNLDDALLPLAQASNRLGDVDQ